MIEALTNLDKSTWVKHRFDEIAMMVSERVDPNKTDLEIYVGLEHLDSESLHIRSHGTADDVNGTKLRFYKGDVIFGRRRAYQRKAAIAEYDGFCSAHALVLRAKPEIIDPALFPFFLHSDQFMHRAVDISVGSLSPTINWKSLRKQEFLLPPKAEQARLAELLWAGDAVLEGLEALLNGTKSAELALRFYLLNPDTGNKYNWRTFRLNSIAKFIDYRGKSPTKTDKGIPLITAKNIEIDYLTEEPREYIATDAYDSWMTRGIPNHNDVLFTTEAPLGNTSLVTMEHKFALAQRIICLQPKREYVYEDYLYHALNNPIFRHGIFRMATGTTVIGIRASVLKKVKINLPDIDDQKKICTKLRALKFALGSLEDKMDTTRTLQKSLINQIF